MIGIYKITNPKGKVYLGQSIDLENRLDRYKYLGSRAKQHKLNNSIEKYGFENHIMEIIEICSLEELDEREIFYIKQYNCVKEGLNIKHGGEGGGLMEEETKQKIASSNKGKKHSLQTRKQMSQSKINHPMYTDEWRESISEANFGGTNSKPITQYDKNGKFIKKWNSKAKAARRLNINPISIANVTTGRSKTAGGFIWKNSY